MSKVKSNTRCYEVTMTVYADADATAEDVGLLVRDLSWTGGCYHDSDPRFYCLDVKHLRIRRAARLDRKAK